MAALAPGILLKLLDGMNSGSANPVGVHRNALLQITDIVPVDLDEKSLLPKRGFYIKVSDSSHSIYVSLPFDQGDLVMSNKMQLGQFIHVDRLDPGSPVPIMKGTKPIPGRHPLVGTPVQIKGKGERSDPSRTRSVSASRVHLVSSTRGSWERNDGAVVIKPTVLNFESGTPITTGRRMDGERRKSGIMTTLRSSVNRSLLLSKSTNSKKDDDGLSSSSASSLVRKSFSSSKFFRSKSVTNGRRDIPKSLLPTVEDKKNLTPPTPVRVATRTESPSPMRINPPEKKKKKSTASTPYHQLPLPGKLRLIEKEVMQQKEATHKIALQALRDATAAETVAKLLIMFSDLSSTAKAEAPANCFDKFLAFYQETIHALTNMETATTPSDNNSEEEEEEEGEGENSAVLHEIAHNKVTRRNAIKTPKSRQSKTTIIDRRTRTSSSSPPPPPPSSSSGGGGGLFNSIKLAKQLQTESGIWFMDFLDAALEKGMKTTTATTTATTTKEGTQRQCLQSAVLLKIINWVEMEQNDGSKRSVHPRAKHVARKLRIKVKNPYLVFNKFA